MPVMDSSEVLQSLGDYLVVAERCPEETRIAQSLSVQTTVTSILDCKSIIDLTKNLGIKCRYEWSQDGLVVLFDDKEEWALFKIAYTYPKDDELVS